LFIIDESTDSRAYFVGNKGQREETPMQLPNLARLMKEGTSFNNTYVHVPVCCPSRATIASGRFQHRIPHMQTGPETGLHVNGAWNNHEGLDTNYSLRYDQLLERIGGYNVKIVGKTDWTTGSHSVPCRVQSWTNKVPFPYTLANHSSGMSDEATGPICYGDNNTANETHPGDWKYTATVAAFIKAEGQMVKDFIRTEGKQGPRQYNAYTLYSLYCC
jgi:arylsulfatase A-like enzyme